MTTFKSSIRPTATTTNTQKSPKNDRGFSTLIAVDEAMSDYERMKVIDWPDAEGLLLTAESSLKQASGHQENGCAIAQITAALQVQNITYLHIIAPCSPGSIHFTTGDFNGKTLGLYADSLQTWFAPASSEGPNRLEPEIFIHSGNFDANREGKMLIDHLHFLTGAAVTTTPLRKLPKCQ